MKIKHQKLIVAILLFLSMQQCFSITPMQKAEQSQQELQNSEYPRYSTDKYIYAISSTEQPAEEGVVIEPVVISDKTVGNYLNNGKTRTLIMQETKDGKLITTTETWKTKNPSYMTVRNGAIVVGTAAVVAATYMVLAKMRDDAAIITMAKRFQELRAPI